MIALVAHVGNVDALMFGDDFSERYQFISFGIVTGRINQSRGHAERAFLHCLVRQRAHLLEFGGRGRPVGAAEHVHPWRRGADEGRDIGRDAVPLESLEPLVERVPVDVVLDVALLTQLLGSHIVVERAHGLAFAEDLERNALQQIAHASAVGKESVRP